MTENAPEAPERERSDRPIPSEPRVWPVFAAWVMAFVTIVILSILAAALVASLYPDVAPSELLRQLPGLLAGASASSLGLILTILLVDRTLDPARLRLRPGRETGRDLVLMILGMLALGQTLDSLTTLVGLGRRGALWDARQTLMGVAGADLFAAVLVIGLLAGSAEELFFRGFMQTRLRARWPTVWAVAGHERLLRAHAHRVAPRTARVPPSTLSWVHYRASPGSALPAVVAHIVNNTLFTLLTALGGIVCAFLPILALLGAGVVIFVTCIVLLRRALPPRSA